MPPGSKESLASQRLPRKVESLESLYFTPIPSRTRSQLESSAVSLDDLSLDSGCKTRSARRRTTINITMTKVSRPRVWGREGSVGQDLCAEDGGVWFAVPHSPVALGGREAKMGTAWGSSLPLPPVGGWGCRRHPAVLRKLELPQGCLCSQTLH